MLYLKKNTQKQTNKQTGFVPCFRVDSTVHSDSDQVLETSSDDCAEDVIKLSSICATDEPSAEGHSSDQEWTPENSGEQTTTLVQETSSDDSSDPEWTPENSGEQTTTLVPETSSDDSSDPEWTPENIFPEPSAGVVLETSSYDSSDQECTVENSGFLQTLSTVPKTNSEEQKMLISASQNPLAMSEVLSTTGTSSADSVKDGIYIKSTEGKKWDKQHACKYCGKLIIKMSDHLQRVHGTEFEVVRVLATEKGSLCRRRAWSQLLKEGDYEHNFKVLQNEEGGYIPKYRSKKQRAVEDFVPCHICKGSYKRSLLYLHVQSGKRQWSAEESAAVHRQLQPWIEMCRIPKKQECEEALKKESALSQRNWRAIKFFVYSLIQKKKKKDR